MSILGILVNVQAAIGRSRAEAGGRLDLIDVGSCYDPFSVFPEFNVRLCSRVAGCPALSALKSGGASQAQRELS